MTGKSNHGTHHLDTYHGHGHQKHSHSQLIDGNSPLVRDSANTQGSEIMYKIQILARSEDKVRKRVAIPKGVKVEIVNSFTDYNSDDEDQVGPADDETERKRLVPQISPKFPEPPQSTQTTSKQMALTREGV